MKPPSVFTLTDPTNGNLSFKIFSFEDNSYFDHVQRNNYYSIVWIREGKGKLKVDFYEYDFDASVIVCFSPYQPFMILSEGALKGEALYFHPDFFCVYKHQKEVDCNGVLFNNIYDPPFIEINKEVSLVFSQLLEQMKTEMQKPALAQCDLLLSYLKIYLITASRLKVEQYPDLYSEKTGTREPFVLQNLREAIEKHFRTKHSASDYADLLNISAKALARVTKNYFNKTLTELISERIIIEAKRELYLTNKTVKEISYGLGYEDEHYFSRFFKANTDVSPLVYRETVGFARDITK